MMDFWNWSLWMLVPLVIVLIILVAAAWSARNDPKLVAQRNRYRAEGEAKGFLAHDRWSGVATLVLIASWVVGGIAFSRSNYGAGIVFIVAPLVLSAGVTSLERRRYKERKDS
jgi:hypothetical protein